MYIKCKHCNNAVMLKGQGYLINERDRVCKKCMEGIPEVNKAVYDYQNLCDYRSRLLHGTRR